MMTFAFSLTNVGSILIFIVIICFLIAWHELGHLLTAKKFNIYCYEYSIGFGPIIYKNKKKETHFVLRAIPLGGFVKIAGEDGTNENEVVKGNDGNPIPSERLFSNSSCLRRGIVLAAGGIMNIIFAIFCFYFYLTFNVIGSTSSQTSPFNGISENATGYIIQTSTNEVAIVTDSYLDHAGMETHDRIVEIKTKYSTESEYISYQIENSNDMMNAINSKIPTEEGQIQDIIITFKDYSNNNELVTINGITRTGQTITNEEDGTKAYTITQIGVASYRIREYNGLTALYGTFEFTGLYTVEMLKALGSLFTGNLNNLSGLVGIYQTVDTVNSATGINAAEKILNLFYLAGAISFSLGFFNLIPFPALDGGRLVFVILEAIRKKKVNSNVEATIHFVGIIILFALMIIINIRDIIGLF